MTPVVFIIGVLNLVLGFALAVLLEKRIVVPVPSLRFQPAPASDDVVFECPILPAATDSMREQLPREWEELLRSTDRQCSTILEAGVEILSLAVAAYREDLLDTEDLVRRAMDEENPDAVHDALQRLMVLNQEWIATQCDVLKVLAGKRDDFGEFGEIGSRLESMLLDQSSLIEDRCAEIQNLDVHNDTRASAIIARCLGDLVRMAHELRDTMQVERRVLKVE